MSRDRPETGTDRTNSPVMRQYRRRVCPGALSSTAGGYWRRLWHNSCAIDRQHQFNRNKLNESCPAEQCWRHAALHAMAPDTWPAWVNRAGCCDLRRVRNNSRDKSARIHSMKIKMLGCVESFLRKWLARSKENQPTPDVSAPPAPER